MAYKITLKQSGKVLEYGDDEKMSLLEFLEDNNIAADSGCRAAACGVCAQTCLEGNVKKGDDHLFSAEEIKEGRFLACVAWPGSDITLDL